MKNLGFALSLSYLKGVLYKFGVPGEGELTFSGAYAVVLKRLRSYPMNLGG